MMQTLRAVMLILLLGAINTSALGFSFEDLWKRRDEQGYEQFKKGHLKEAAKLFDNPEWQGAASYRAGDYKKAQEAFAKGRDKISYYNLGNALAQQGEFTKALTAYDIALEKDPAFDDAKYNRELIAKLLKDELPQENKSTASAMNKPDNTENKKSEDTSEEASKKENEASQESSTEKETLQAQSSQLTPAQEQQSSDQEKEQAKQQLMRQVADEPGGLLRQKFLRDHQRYVLNEQEG